MPTNDNVKRVLEAIAYLMTVIEVAIDAIGAYGDDDEARANVNLANGALIHTVITGIDTNDERYSEFYNLYSVVHALMLAQIPANIYIEDIDVKRRVMTSNYQTMLDGCALSIAINE